MAVILIPRIAALRTKREEKAAALFPRAYARVPTIVFVFCLHSFTGRDKSLRNSRLRVKAKNLSAFTAFTGFSFTGKSLICSGLGILVKAMKAKTRLSCSNARVRARENEWEQREIYLRDKCNYLRGRRNYL